MGRVPADETQATNVDPVVVRGFGDEWKRFDQSDLPLPDFEAGFSSYFRIFPWASLPVKAVGFDLGCGSGRWAKGVAPRVGRLHCIDASDVALAIARRTLVGHDNVEFHHHSVGSITLSERSMDFGYCLGVLHHVPDPHSGLRSAVRLLKSGAPFLLYLYYAFDNRPRWYRALHATSELLRLGVSRAPMPVRYGTSQLLAGLLYWPLARLARACESLGLNVDGFPLAYYRNRSFYTMRTDAMDRFGTRLERRFTRDEIRGMMEQAGLEHVQFSDRPPYWTAVGFRRS